jgi:hypothetical protein
MSDLIEMTAIAKGTIVGTSGIIHVDPANDGEGGRYSHPRVSEADAVQLEKRKLAVRDSGEVLQGLAASLLGPDGAPVPLGTQIVEPGRVPSAEPIAAPAPVVAAPAAPVAAAEAHAQADASATGAIGNGLDDSDPDMAPAAPAPVVAAPAAPVAAAHRPRGGKKTT